jgi:hypothetical protein
MDWMKIAEYISKAKAALIGNSLDKAFSEVVRLLKESPELRRDPEFVERLLKAGIVKEFEKGRISLRIGLES